MIAWAAGLFEGEGCITVNPKAGRASRPIEQWSLQLTMTDEDVVRKFAQTVGCGSVRANRRLTVSGKPVTTWGVYNKQDIARVLELLKPYFGKRRQARAEECLQSLGDVTIRRRAPKIGWQNSKWREPVQLELPGILH